MFRIVLDHAEPEVMAARLRAAGYHVIAVESPTVDSGALVGLLSRAAADGRVVVTTNAEAADPALECPERHPGILLLQCESGSGDGEAERLVGFLEGKVLEQLRNHIVILSDAEDQWIQHLLFAHEGAEEAIVIPRSSRERFLVAPEPHDQMLNGYDIELAGISDVFPPYRVARHGLAFHLVALVLGGEGQLGVGPGASPLSAGASFKAPAGAICEYRATGPWRFLWFHLRHGGRWDGLFGADIRLEQGLWTNPLLRAAEGFLEEAGRQRPDAGIPLRAYAELIVFYLDRELGQFEDPARIEERDRLERVWRAVHDDPAAPWDVGRMARLAAASVTHFHRLVRRHAGASPMQVVTRMRMDRARELLRHTHYTLEQIADLTGYQSPFALSKAFKRQTGISPHEFRHLGGAIANGKQGYEAGTSKHGARGPK